MSLKHHKFRAAQIARRSTSAVTPGQLAHELNNLLDGSLRGVGMSLRRINELAVDDETRDLIKKYLDTADRSMRQMVDVIDNYANHAADHGSSLHELLDASGSLLDVLTHAINVYGPTAEQRGIELVTRLDPDVSHLPAGPLYTALANAINNALQAIERSPVSNADSESSHRITIRLVRDPQAPNHLLLEVIDTGVGVAPQLLDHQGKFRFGITTRPQGHGVGLGVCRQIAEDLGGQLMIQSNPDRGARFSLTAPLLGTEQHQLFSQDTEPRRAG